MFEVTEEDVERVAQTFYEMFTWNARRMDVQMPDWNSPENESRATFLGTARCGLLGEALANLPTASLEINEQGRAVLRAVAAN